MNNMIGKMLDNRYELLEVIGSGGMAVVYKAKCHRLNRLVAVKVLKSDLAEDADFRRRFRDESQAVAMLSHPNIVSVYDVSRGETEYIVMELIDGITLKQYMEKRGQLNWREALHFITQIMKALSHAHSRGIVHRDIKPQNIMLLRSGQIAVGFVGMRMDEKAFRYVPLLEDHLVLVTENSPCFQDLPAEAGLELLLREPVIARETASGTWLETEKWLRGQGILPERLHILARMENPDAIRRAVARGMGVSVLSSLVVEEDAAAGRLRTFELGQGAWRQICMVLPKRAALTATQTAFADFVRQSAAL